MQKVGPYDQKLLGKTQRKCSRNITGVGKKTIEDSKLLASCKGTSRMMLSKL